MLFNRKLNQEKYFELLKEINPKESSWLAITKNQTIKESAIDEINLNTNGKDDYAISFLRSEGGEVKVAYNKNKFKNSTGEFCDTDQIAAKATSALMHEYLDFHLNTFILRLKNSERTQALDPSGEIKGHEWLRVSFEVLKKAIDHALASEELVFDPTIFIGNRPGTNEELIRIMCYNLDINYQFLSDGSLHVRVFDDKNKNRGDNNKPSFHAVFIGMKNQVMDELIKLMGTIGAGLDLRAR